MAATTVRAHYLGPGRVLDPREEPLVALDDARRARVRMALSVPYRPARGDALLVVGGPSSFYAIGVLRGTGRTRLRAERSLRLQARRLRLAGKTLKVGGPQLRVSAFSRLSTVVTRKVAELGNADRTATGAIDVRAGDLDHVARKLCTMTAGKLSAKVRAIFRLDGGTVRLG